MTEKKTFRSEFARGFQASQPGGVLGPDRLTRALKSFTGSTTPEIKKPTTKQPYVQRFTKNTTPNITKPKIDQFKKHPYVQMDGNQYHVVDKDGKRLKTFDNMKKAQYYLNQNYERLNEGNDNLGDLAHRAEMDHEVQMARAELYKLAKYSIKLHDMLKQISEAEGLEGWMQSKITKASDYISSVYHSLDYDMNVGDESTPTMSYLDKPKDDMYKMSLSGMLEAKKKEPSKPRNPAGAALASNRKAFGKAGAIPDKKKEMDRKAARGKVKMDEAEDGIPFDTCPKCGGPIVHESRLNEKKDACYHKVKSRYKIWPSAYASGALVKCRKVGAKNWGKSGEK